METQRGSVWSLGENDGILPSGSRRRVSDISMMRSSSPGISSWTLIHAPVCCLMDLIMLPDLPITPPAFMSWQRMRSAVVAAVVVRIVATVAVIVGGIK
ncbi:ABC-type sugar transport system, ATPase component [Corchorus olitorius]|uniref:ABC-type sugar transport system, ATPase component n=1 Tax=Corchorus olitorius TaxID=93759 RepID=A0A1R3JFJ3_9ROSI|nr:ABC-type sugar transport system, ATPase component [Corchorus olitorius]